MNIGDMRAIHKNKYRATTDSKHTLAVWPNLLNRNFIVSEPNKIYVSDITYLWTYQGWLYIAVVIDLFSRSVVGLSMSEHIDAILTQNALRQAVIRRNPGSGLIVHSDRGSQYASNDFKTLLENNNFVGSMSKKGDCWDNAVAESFFHTLKVELIPQNKSRTRDETRKKIFEHVEMHYNRRGAHSTIGNLSPFEYERQAILS